MSAGLTRNHILQEIRRTAEANGGIPLGRQRFATETGIKEFDWSKFWAKWSDAIRESGLEPNQFQGAFGESALLKKYAVLIRELGRLPTVNELRMKAHKDPEFPSEKTLRSRFGAKPKLINRVIEHFSGQQEFSDIVNLCQQYKPAPTASNDDVGVLDTEEFGHVYLAKSGRFYKIGRTNATGRREYEIGIQLPEAFTTVHVIATDDPVGIERYWHNRFDAKRKKGEWFALTASDVSAFKRRKFM